MEWDLLKSLIKLPPDDLIFLTTHHKVQDWCSYFKIEIIDNDGFSRYELNTELSLSKFINGIVSCTISSKT